MSKSKEFAKNTIILFIGKFTSQFMSLLLLPLYTHYLLKDDYGIVDLLQTYISLFVPILTLRIDSAAFRFLIDKRNDTNEIKKIVSNIICILFFSIIFTILIFNIVYQFIKIKYFILFMTNIITVMTTSILLQILRGFGKNKEYSFACVITGITTLAFNLILIIILKFGANSILISSSLANFICTLYIIFKINIKKEVSFKDINIKEIKKFLSYSFPMIPNALSWWIVNVSDRTIISFFLGVQFNAIYTISCKFSNILNSFYSIINMSWQESASLHINDKDRDMFFTQMINSIFVFFSTISLLIISVLPFVYNIVIGEDYLISYNYIPILLYANSWNVLIGLIGGIYIAEKKTKQIANTTIISALINIFINLVLIKFIGIYAACISTLLSYMIMGIYRYVDCQKYVNLKINFKKYTFFTIVFILSSLIYLSNNILLLAINLLFILSYSFYINKDLLLKAYVLIIERLKSKN